MHGHMATLAGITGTVIMLDSFSALQTQARNPTWSLWQHGRHQAHLLRQSGQARGSRLRELNYWIEWYRTTGIGFYHNTVCTALGMFDQRTCLFSGREGFHSTVSSSSYPQIMIARTHSTVLKVQSSLQFRSSQKARPSAAAVCGWVAGQVQRSRLSQQLCRHCWT